MATIRERPAGWQAQIRRRGRPSVTRTFRVKADAHAWAAQIESEFARGVYRERRQSERFSLGDVLCRYRDEVTPHKKSASAESHRIAVLLRDPVCRLRLADLRPQDLADWRDRRLAGVSGSSVLRDLTLLSHAFNVARKEWGIAVENPCGLIRRPSENRPRCRRVSKAEEAVLLDELDPSVRTPDGSWSAGGARNPHLKPLVIAAIETAMRRGELLALRWTDVFLEERFVRLHTSKNGQGRDVPLSTRAAAVLAALPRHSSGCVFPVSAEAVKQGFRRAVERAGLVDMHFHDLRHEATTRIAARLSGVHELAAITGHTSLEMLQRYFHPSASDLALKLG